MDVRDITMGVVDINALVRDINKKHGMNAIRPATDIVSVSLNRIPSGSISLDEAMGGGFPIGRMIVLAGNFSTYKSTLCYHAIKNAQKMRKKKVLWEKYSTKEKPVHHWIIAEDGDVPLTCAIIQAESESYTNEYAEKVGVDTSKLVLVYPASMEEGLEIALDLQKAGIDLIVHDSYTAYTPAKVLETETDDTYQMGLKQKAFGDYHGRYQSINNKLDREGNLPCTILAVCQLREKIGGMGNPEYVPGGRSVGHTSSIEVRFRKGDYVSIGANESKQNIGQVIKFKVEKNKTYKQYQTGQFDMYFDEGGAVPPSQIDNAKELIVLAIMYGLIEKRGSWFYYKENQIAQGEANSIEVIRNDPTLYEELKKKVMSINAVEDVIPVTPVTPVTKAVIGKFAKGKKKK